VTFVTDSALESLRLKVERLGSSISAKARELLSKSLRNR